jgi:hypothetical protein
VNADADADAFNAEERHHPVAAELVRCASRGHDGAADRLEEAVEDEHDIIYFFRRRLALATARLCQGPSTEAIDALPPLEISLSPDVAAAMAFSRTMRWYSTGEHLF